MIYTFVEPGGQERALQVEVANTPHTRVRGLQGRSDISPNAGLLFDFGSDLLVAFTGAGCLDRIRAQFFDNAGKKVDDFWIDPGAGPYWPSRRFRFVLESFDGVEYQSIKL